MNENKRIYRMSFDYVDDIGNDIDRQIHSFDSKEKIISNTNVIINDKLKSKYDEEMWRIPRNHKSKD